MVKEYGTFCLKTPQTAKQCHPEQTKKIRIKINPINRLKKLNSSTC